jgi:hypothetical protein
MSNIFSESNSIFSGVTNGIGEVVGSLAARDQVEAKPKRGLTDEVFETKSKRANLVTGSLSAANLAATLNLGINADDKVGLHAFSCCVSVVRLTWFILGEEIVQGRERRRAGLH